MTGIDIVPRLKFDEFWSLLAKELASSKKFSLPSQSKEFEAKYSGGRILVTTSADILWAIEMSTMHEIWDKASAIEETRRFVGTNYNQSTTRTLSYILMLIKHFVANRKME